MSSTILDMLNERNELDKHKEFTECQKKLESFNKDVETNITLIKLLTQKIETEVDKWKLKKYFSELYDKLKWLESISDDQKQTFNGLYDVVLAVNSILLDSQDVRRIYSDESEKDLIALALRVMNDIRETFLRFTEYKHNKPDDIKIQIKKIKRIIEGEYPDLNLDREFRKKQYLTKPSGSDKVATTNIYTNGGSRSVQQ